MNIYVFGNPLIPEDSGPVILIPKLTKEFPEISFVHADPSGYWWRGDTDLWIIDTVLGIHEVTLFTSLEEIETTQSLTVHDYDLYMDLQLMKKLRKIKSFNIIGVPATKPADTKKISEIIREVSVKSV